MYIFNKKSFICKLLCSKTYYNAKKKRVCWARTQNVGAAKQEGARLNPHFHTWSIMYESSTCLSWPEDLIIII